VHHEEQKSIAVESHQRANTMGHEHHAPINTVLEVHKLKADKQFASC
jgi:hypothetical protein